MCCGSQKNVSLISFEYFFLLKDYPKQTNRRQTPFNWHIVKPGIEPVHVRLFMCLKTSYSDNEQTVRGAVAQWN